MFLGLAQRVFFLFNIIPSGSKTFILPYCCELQVHVVFEGLDGKHLSVPYISEITIFV